MTDPIEAMVLGPLTMHGVAPRFTHSPFDRHTILGLDTAKPRIASLTAESKADLDAIVEGLRKIFKDSCEQEIACQMVMDTGTGEVKRIVPVMKNGNFVSLQVKTADGFESYCEHFNDKETETIK